MYCILKAASVWSAVLHSADCPDASPAGEDVSFKTYIMPGAVSSVCDKLREPSLQGTCPTG